MILRKKSNASFHPLKKAHNDGQENEGFPGLIDWVTIVEGLSSETIEVRVFTELIKMHYKTVIATISNAIKIIDEVYVL